MTKIEIIKTIGTILSVCISCITFLTLIIKPLRTAFIRWFKRTAKKEVELTKTELNQQTQSAIGEVNEKINKLCDMLDIHVKHDEMMATAQNEVLKCMLRNEINKIYYKYFPAKRLPVFERENLIELYKRYSEEPLNGNSYVHTIYTDMMAWEVQL